MKVALEVWSSDYKQVLATCRLAEELGFDAFYYGESPHDLNLECWSTLGALAEATTTIRLGPVITNVLPSYRNPMFHVRQAAAVDAISSGRLDFRTGVGAARAFARPWWEPSRVAYPDYEQRLVDLEAALDLVDAGLPGVPVTIAATGNRAMKLASRRAHVWETSFCTPEEFAARNKMMQQLSPGQNLTRSLEIDGFLAKSKSGVDRLLEQVGVERGDGEDLDQVFDRALLGEPSQVVKQLVALHSAGVDQIVVALHNPHDPAALETLAATVALYDKLR